jgi:large subunit ribosomal protein L21
MYAVIETGGKQYRVSQDATLRVESLAGEPGNEIVFDKGLALVTEDGSLKTGSELSDVKVNAKIQSHGRGPKVIVFKFKRKKQYKKTIGHRQNFTEVIITGIEA